MSGVRFQVSGSKREDSEAGFLIEAVPNFLVVLKLLWVAINE